MSGDAPLELAGDFPPVTEEAWRAAVDKVLKGADFATTLVTETYDGIDVQPLYTATSEVPGPATAAPGFWPFVRSSELLGPAPDGWDVRQPLTLEPVEGPGTPPAVGALERGATSLLLRPGRAGAEGIGVDLLDTALEGVQLDLIALALESDLGVPAAQALLELARRRGLEPAALRATLGIDPIGAGASSGVAPGGDALGEATDLASACAADWPGVRAWVVDATRYHEAGAADTEELALATATGVAYLRLLSDAGLDPEAALGQLEFRFAVTGDQFSSIAKLRAGRRLWARVAQVIGCPGAGGQHQHAITSRAMLSRYDPWVNLLRNTTACFAAGVGGAQAVTVEAHDLAVAGEEPSALAGRLARNTQLLLIEECHLGRVVDPGGGSWYLEWLTETMAETAWSLFTDIEARGGMADALGSGFVRDRIEATWARRTGRLADRTDTLIGVSDFPNPLDRPPERPAAMGPAGTEPVGAGLPRRRWAEPFEALRERVDAHDRRTGGRPGVLVVRLGKPSASTARATWAANLFGTAGLRIVDHDLEGTGDPEVLAAAAAEGGAVLACLCSSDAVYADQGEAAAAAVSGAGLARTYVAGRPGEVGDALLAAGADELVYAGCDVLDALRRVLSTCEVP